MGCSEDSAKVDFVPVDPVAVVDIDSPEDDPTAVNVNEPDPAGEAVRKASVARLSKAGFTVASTLPTTAHRRGLPGKLRPVEEIASRALALKALFMWVSAPEEYISSRELIGFIERNKLRKSLTAEEAAILELSRIDAQQQHGNGIGWKLENLWALCWALGFKTEPDPTMGQLPNEVTDAFLLDFLPNPDSDLQDLVKKAKARSADEIIALEDLFYCSHNAVTSAQTGATECVPEGFHPLRDGGAIHERRHSLTWILSPKTEWDDTDLST